MDAPAPPWQRSRLAQGAASDREPLEENRTTHRADFARERGDKVYLAKIGGGRERRGARRRPRSPTFPAIVGGAVAIINASTFTLVSAITGGTTNPYGVAATPDGSQVWVTESGTNTVSVISTSANKITTPIVVGIYPHGIAITPDGKTAYVANTGPNTGPGGS